MTRAAVLCLLLSPCLLAAEDKQPDVQKELTAIKGKWKVAAAKYNGKDLETGERVLVFDEKEFTAFNGKEKLRALAYTLDPAADPKRIDLARAGTDTKSAGIYALDGDKLTLCYAEPGAERPKKFESKADGKTFLLVLERVK